MTLFMFLLFPIVLVMYCICHKGNKSLPVVVVGFMAGILVCGIKMVFFFPHRVVPFSFLDNFLYLLLTETLLPSVILGVLFLIFSKDTPEYKGNAIFPLLLSFYTSYLPYVIINSSLGFKTLFSLVLKPILYMTMILTIGIMSKESGKFLTNKKFRWVIAVFCIFLPVVLVLPAALESWYIVSTDITIPIWGTILFPIYAFIYLIFTFIKRIKNGDVENNQFEDLTNLTIRQF